jgi:hypothetical protein
MRAFVVVLLLVACDGEESPPDARVCPSPPAVEQRCYSTCGNGTIDSCFKSMNSHCGGAWYQTHETCDGSVGLSSCIDRGFCGGTTKCDTTFCIGVDVSGCTPCP